MLNKNVTITKLDNGDISFTLLVSKTFKTSGGGYWSNIVKDVVVHSITQTLSEDGGEADDGYWCGDLAVNYDGSGKNGTWFDGSDLQQNGGLLNKLKADDSDGLIYTDNGFMQALHAELIAAGFDSKAVEDIGYSEQGMQEDGRVSCDAYDFGDELLKHANK